MKIIELFCGTKSFSSIAKERGHQVFTIDIDKQFNPDLCIDILNFNISMLPREFQTPDIIWASPPCTTFSVASISRYWVEGKPKNEKTLLGISIVQKTLDIINKLKPKFYIIENPRGMLRKQDFMLSLNRNTVSYCQYGAKVMKPTDLWNNIHIWKPRTICKPKADCHDHQPRTYKSKLKAGVLHLGTQGRKNTYENSFGNNPRDRAIVPKELCLEILEACVIK